MTGAGSGRLRVAVIALEWPSSDRHAGGVGRYAKRLCEWLSSRVELTVITGPEPQPLEGEGRLVTVEIGRPGGRFARYYIGPLRAARLVATLGADVVHSHGDDWPLALSPVGHPPIVRTYYGRSAAEARSGALIRRANHWVLAGIEVACRRRYATAVGIGPDSAAAFRCPHLIPPVFGRAATGPAVKDRQPSAIFVGGFRTRKRGYLALRAVAEARRVVPELRLAVVGPEEDRSSYPGWVEFHAALDDAAVRSMIGRAWVLVAPSTYEGFGIPVWEAMAAGTAVLATSSPGIDFLRGDGASCTVVDDDDLGCALAALVQSDSVRLEKEQSGLVRASEVADLGRPERYLDLFCEATRR